MRVAISALGAVCGLGNNFKQIWHNLLQAKSAIKLLQPCAEQIGQEYLSNQYLGAPLDKSALNILSVKQRKYHDIATQYALVATLDLLQNAAANNSDSSNIHNNTLALSDILASLQLSASRTAVCFAPGLGNISSVVNMWEALRTKGEHKVSPMAIPMLMPNAAAAAVALLLQAKRGAHSPVSACASGAEAIAWGAQLIADQQADVVVAGGCDAGLHPLALASFMKMRALSTNYTQPAFASRPFSASRDGFVMGEGAACLLLESETHALARGAKVIAWLDGWGVSCDAYDVAPPDPSGIPQKEAVIQALMKANLNKSDIQLVNPHATSTPVGDAIEAKIINTLFPQAYVSATKASTGHLLGAAGALEAAFCAQAIATKTAPPTITAHLDPEFSINLVGPHPITLSTTSTNHCLSAISTSFGFGGHNYAIAMREYN